MMLESIEKWLIIGTSDDSATKESRMIVKSDCVGERYCA